MSQASSKFSDFLKKLSSNEHDYIENGSIINSEGSGIISALLKEKNELPWVSACDYTINKIQFEESPEHLRANHIDLLTSLLSQVPDEKFGFKNEGGRFSKGIIVSINAARSMKNYQDHIFCDIGALFYGIEEVPESMWEDNYGATAMATAIVDAATPKKNDQKSYSYMLHNFSENYRSREGLGGHIYLLGNDQNKLLKKISGYQKSIQDMTGLIKKGKIEQLINRTDIIADLTQFLPQYSINPSYT